VITIGVAFDALLMFRVVELDVFAAFPE